MPVLTESHQRELREEEEAASSPANCEREEGPGLTILVLARTEVEPGEDVSEGPDPVPQQDGGNLQHAADQAVLDSPEVGVAGLGGEESLGRDLRGWAVRDYAVLRYPNIRITQERKYPGYLQASTSQS